MKIKTASDKALEDWFMATNPAGEKYAEFWGKILEEYGFKRIDDAYSFTTFYKLKDITFSIWVNPPKPSIEFSGAINNDNLQGFKEKFKDDVKLREFLNKHFKKS